MRAATAQRWVLVGLIAAVGLIHLVTAPDQFHDATYKGLLFLANAAAALAAAVGLARGARWGVLLGLLVAGGAAVGYIVSRTVGLPGLPVGAEWFEPFGVAALIAETGFIVLSLPSLQRRRPATRPVRA